MALSLVGAGDDPAGEALFVIDPALRLGGVGVAQANLGRLQVLRARDILRAGQLVEPEKGRGRAEHVELTRRVVDQRLVIFGDDRVALAAAQHRPGEVVDVGEIVPVGQLPIGRLIFDIGMEALRAMHAIGRDRERSR